MNQVKLNNLIKEPKIVLPLYVLKTLKKYNLTSDEIIVLIYLYDKNTFVFNPEKISIDLEMDLLYLMEVVSNLNDKGIIEVKTSKNENGLMEETINLDSLYNNITLDIMNVLNSNQEEDNNVFELIEGEFNRKLTPLECEVINDWEKNNYNKQLIKEAVKRASLNGVTNLRYIDKILFDWNKQGIKKPSEIENESKDKKDGLEVIDYNDYNWFDEDEEEI